MATISAWAIDRPVPSTRLTPAATSCEPRNTVAANGPPPRSAFCCERATVRVIRSSSVSRAPRKPRTTSSIQAGTARTTELPLVACTDTNYAILVSGTSREGLHRPSTVIESSDQRRSARLLGVLGRVVLAGRASADALVAAFVALVPFGAYYRLWLSGPRAQYLWGDTNSLYWPDLVYLYRALIHFQVPLWNPFERGGVSMLSEPEAGGLYPVNWLLLLVGAPGGMPFVMVEIKACL